MFLYFIIIFLILVIILLLRNRQDKKQKKIKTQHEKIIQKDTKPNPIEVKERTEKEKETEKLLEEKNNEIFKLKTELKQKEEEEERLRDLVTELQQEISNAANEKSKKENDLKEASVNTEEFPRNEREDELQKGENFNEPIEKIDNTPETIIDSKDRKEEKPKKDNTDESHANEDDEENSEMFLLEKDEILKPLFAESDEDNELEIIFDSTKKEEKKPTIKTDFIDSHFSTEAEKEEELFDPQDENSLSFEDLLDRDDSDTEEKNVDEEEEEEETGESTVIMEDFGKKPDENLKYEMTKNIEKQKRRNSRIQGSLINLSQKIFNKLSESETEKKEFKKRLKEILKKYGIETTNLMELDLGGLSVDAIKEIQVLIDQGSEKKLELSEEDKKRRRVEGILEEFLLTEIDYVNHLETLQKIFVEPCLKEKIAPSLSSFFGQIGIIKNINTLFLDNLKKVFTPDSSNIEKISETCKLISNFAQTFKLYTDYVSKFTQYDELIREQVKKNKKFSRFLNSKEDLLRKKKERFIDIHSYLIIPVQRIPRYKLLLNDLNKYVTIEMVGEKEKKKLEIAFATVEEIAKYCNDKTKEVRGFQKIRDLIVGLGLSEGLIAPHRKLIREGTTNRIRKNGTALASNIYLLSDLLILTPIKKPIDLTFFKRPYLFILTDPNTKVEYDPEFDESEMYINFVNKNGEEKKCHLDFKTLEDCSSWYDSINQQAIKKRIVSVRSIHELFKTKK